MPGRITPLINEGFYHIFNRGSDKRDIFLETRDYSRFLKVIYYYHFSNIKIRFSIFNKSKIDFFTPLSDSRLVEIISYCLMPNHFHLLLKQVEDGGISKFLSQISNSYTKYFNTKNKRAGPLLQGAFKAVPIESDEQLIHVSRYIHLNPIVANICQNLSQYKWSSFTEFKYGSSFSSTEEILKFFKSPKEYQTFLEEQIDYGTTLEILKHYHLLDED